MSATMQVCQSTRTNKGVRKEKIERDRQVCGGVQKCDRRGKVRDMCRQRHMCVHTEREARAER